jgi:ribosomal protein S18 acetylase RimI-like enzyme
VGVWIRPDSRCFVHAPEDLELVAAGCDVYASTDEADANRLHAFERAGFEVHRRQLELLLPTDPALTGLAGALVPDGFSLARADEVDERRLRLLDDELRQDTPGTDGWRWTAEDFHDETYASPHFDPALYLVAVCPVGALAGICRVWLRPEHPKLGFVGVVSAHRRRGVALWLVAETFAVLHERGLAEAWTEVDETNVASRALLEGLGGRRVGASLELIRRGG